MKRRTRLINEFPTHGLKRIAIAVLIVFVAQLSATEKPTPLRIFVSLQGKDTWSGKLVRPSSNGADGPFRNLEAARDAIRSLPQDQREKHPIEICILPGTYVRKEPFVLDARDSGSETAPVVYRSWTDESVVISGGKAVRDWTRTDLNGHRVLVSDLSRLPEAIRRLSSCG